MYAHQEIRNLRAQIQTAHLSGVPRRVWLALPLEVRYFTPAADLYRRQLWAVRPLSHAACERVMKEAQLHRAAVGIAWLDPDQ